MAKESSTTDQADGPAATGGEKSESVERLETAIGVVCGTAMLVLILYSGRISFSTWIGCTALGAVIGVLYNVLFARGMRLGLLVLMVLPFVAILSMTGTLLAGLCYVAGLLLAGMATMRLRGEAPESGVSPPSG